MLLTDEGAGIHAVNLLKEMISHPDIEIIDGATLGLDLIGFFDRAERIFIIDCVRGGGQPGEIYKFGLEDVKKGRSGLKFSLHDFNLMDVLELARSIGKEIPEIRFYGVEPASFEWGLEPTPAVRKGIEELVKIIVDDLRAEFGNDILIKKGGE